jgi:condensin complex subunit 1
MHPVPKRIYELILEPSESMEWFGFAEQAIGAIYNLIEQPDLTCAKLIKTMAGNIFSLNISTDLEIDKMTNALSNIIIANKNKGHEEEPQNEILKEDPVPEPSLRTSSMKLAQLIFVVGHVAIKQMVHLECIESEWKRRKHLKDTEAQSKPRADLEMVTGSMEDEFAEKMINVKERELLYGQNSLLGIFGPIITNICLHPHRFNV